MKDNKVFAFEYRHEYILLFFLLCVLMGFFSSSKREPTQLEIQNLEFVKSNGGISDFPRPQISRDFRKLSNLVFTPLNNLLDFIPNKTNPLIVRDTERNITKDRVYLPEYYRKDRLSGNDIGTEEYRLFSNNDKPDNSWSDTNVSEHPKFYTSDIQSELTNIGAFFDKNNQYNDKTSQNTEPLVSDNCYLDKNGRQFCETATRLQNIPPSLITNIESCNFMNTIGKYKNKNNEDPISFHSTDNSLSRPGSHIGEKTVNGGEFYNNVFAATQTNKTNAPVLVDLFDNSSI